MCTRPPSCAASSAANALFWALWSRLCRCAYRALRYIGRNSGSKRRWISAAMRTGVLLGDTAMVVLYWLHSLGPVLLERERWS